MISQPQPDEGDKGEPLFWILALDGGGLRGAFSAHLLKRIEDEFTVSVSSRFDLVAGTSTGSILAAAIVLQRPLSAVEDLYADHGPAIFLGRWWSAGGKLASKYDAVRLKSVLEGELGATLLGEIARPALLIPAADIGNGQVHVFKSQYNKEFVRDKGVRVADAVLASCSAPTFFAPHVVGDYRLVDGGIWANNPSVVAAIDAIRRFGVEAARIRILSIGTGAERFTYPRGRGLLSRMGFPHGVATREAHRTHAELAITGVDKYGDPALGQGPYSKAKFFRFAPADGRPYHHRRSPCAGGCAVHRRKRGHPEVLRRSAPHDNHKEIGDGSYRSEHHAEATPSRLA